MWTSPVRVREVWVRRRPGPLLVRFDVPALELAGAIARGWSLRAGGPPWLLLPNPDRPGYLTTYPLPRWNLPAPGEAWIYQPSWDAKRFLLP